MAEEQTNFSKLDTFRDEQRRGAMSQVVKPHARQLGGAQ